MINPIVLIITAAILVSILVVSIINKPKKPIVTGTIIIILVGYILMTYLVDNSLAAFDSAMSFDGLVCFIVMNGKPTYQEMEAAFNTLKIMDISLIIISLASLMIEIMAILRKDAKR